MSDIIESWEQEIAEQELLDESVDDFVNKTFSRLVTMYTHMVKYKYTSDDYQDNDWKTTIQNDCDGIKKIAKTKNIKNGAMKKAEEAFKEGIRQAKIEDSHHNQTVRTDEIPDHPIDKIGSGTFDWFDLDDLSDRKKVDEWLNDYNKPKWHDGLDSTNKKKKKRR